MRLPFKRIICDNCGKRNPGNLIKDGKTTRLTKCCVYEKPGDGWGKTMTQWLHIRNPFYWL